jgi:hypothetical protein
VGLVPVGAVLAFMDKAQVAQAHHRAVVVVKTARLAALQRGGILEVVGEQLPLADVL